MVERNARKQQILTYLSVVEDATARDIADVCDITIHNARTLLARYHRYGLLSRYTADRYGTRVYAITTKGVERLDWLRDEDAFHDADDADLETLASFENEVEDEEETFPREAIPFAGESNWLTEWMRLSLAEQREHLRREEAKVRALEAQIHAMKTGNWTEALRLHRYITREEQGEEP